MHKRWHHCEKISLYQKGSLKEEIALNFTGNGYFHEIEEVNKCLANGDTESHKLPLQTSLELISTIDLVRDKIGLHYNLIWPFTH